MLTGNPGLKLKR